SLAMTLYGMETTVDIGLDAMIRHGAAVAKHTALSCVIVDMPAGSYEAGVDVALASARRIMDETGADGVKLEGGVAMAPQIKAITDAGIPLMAHIGLLPQSVISEGGYKIKGRSEDGIAALEADLRAAENAGAFSVVIEGTIEDAAARLSAIASIPTIGIGASVDCDGQILVTEDMIGLNPGHVPKFVRSYATTGDDIRDAVSAYADDVRARAFPGAENVYRGAVKKEEAPYG
ncbi:MAG: 3-methyl-2-oxobutanoate hydroxymethyltransferase, partial [Pikeienuella sp.]